MKAAIMVPGPDGGRWEIRDVQRPVSRRLPEGIDVDTLRDESAHPLVFLLPDPVRQIFRAHVAGLCLHRGAIFHHGHDF